MYSARTDYFLARIPADYRKVHAFFRTEAQHQQRAHEQLGSEEYRTEAVRFPTVFAMRDEKVIGVMASKHIADVGLVAAPFHIAYDLKNYVPTALRLIECYECVLRSGHIPSYVVIMPNYKRGAMRIFKELHESEVLGHAYDGRFDIINVLVPTL